MDMSPLASSPLLFRDLSIELLEQVFLFTSPRDILRLSLVNRACHKLVQGSPSIQHEIDLFAVGLQRNPRFEGSIANCRVALEACIRRRETLNPVEKWNKTTHRRDWAPHVVAVNGVHGLPRVDRIQFFILGSISWGIPRREWDIPLKDIDVWAFTFYPRANVVAIAGNENGEAEWEWKIHLRTLNGGEPHPSARTPVLSYTFKPQISRRFDEWDMSITSSRLALWYYTCDLISHLAVWDWTTGEILLDLENDTYQSVAFVDDLWLVILLCQRRPLKPPALVFLNTARETPGGEEFTQTTFFFDLSGGRNLATGELVFDKGGYQPSREDDLFAPFYPDPSQRVFGVEFMTPRGILVIKIGALFRMAQERKGEQIQWEEWRAHVTRVLRDVALEKFMVSGPQLFCMTETDSGVTLMDVYDLSARASTRDTGTGKDGMAERFKPTATQVLPQWGLEEPMTWYGCPGGIAFVLESEDRSEYTLHVWNYV